MTIGNRKMQLTIQSVRHCHSAVSDCARVSHLEQRVRRLRRHLPRNMELSVIYNNLDNVFTLFVENLKLVVEKLIDDESTARPISPDFKMEELLSNLDAVLKALSFDATKVAMSFKTPPLPTAEDCKQLLSGAEGRAVALVSLYYRVPNEAGRCLRKAMKKLCINVVSGFRELLIRIKTDRYQSSQELLTNTGTIWAACDCFTSAPKNNRDATLVEIQSEMGLVKDALEEVQEAQSSDDGGSMAELMDEIDTALTSEEGPDPSLLPHPRGRTDREKAVLVPLLGLTKACRNCLKKIRGAIKENGKTSLDGDTLQLDGIVDVVLKISPHLDELVYCIYTPVNMAALESNAVRLAGVMNKLLDRTQGSHVCTEGDIQWIDFLRKATEHNLDQLKNITKQHGGR